ncbi:MAG: acetamidase/formamidase family protein [Halobacteria archaeon]
MKKISFRDVGLRYTFSPNVEPVARVVPGESLVLEIQDASSGQVRRKEDVRDKSKIPFANPVVGPIYIENAEPGDTVSIFIQNIKPLEGMGAVYFLDSLESYLTGVSLSKFLQNSLNFKTVICDIRNGFVELLDGIKIPYKPMLGTIAVAPHPEIESISTFKNPGPHGGNMDLPDIGPGSRVFLPVYHSGGLVYLGDAHAAQGDGEIFGVAIEMPAEVIVKFELHKGRKIEWPRIETDEELITVVSASGGREIKDAIVEAYLQLALWIEERYNLDRHDTLVILGQTGKIRIGNLWTAAAKISKRLLDGIY